jgi:phosphoribosyl-dephospho-CoA transferase
MLKTRIIALIIISVVSIVSVKANSANQDSINIAVKGLSQKLQSDLALSKVNVKLGHVENQNISEDKVIVSGFGTVQSAKNISVTFDVVINPVKRDVVEVNYDIVSPVAVEPKSATENFLMKKVMSKIKDDYKTEQIVMAIDGFEAVKSIDGSTNYVGVAEIRVGMEWNRIEFDVAGDSKNGTASNIRYKVVE